MKLEYFKTFEGVGWELKGGESCGEADRKAGAFCGAVSGGSERDAGGNLDGGIIPSKLRQGFRERYSIMESNR